MRIGMQVWGTAGDVRPLIAFAGGLKAAGHEVTIAVTSPDNKDYTAICENLKIKYMKVPGHINVDLTLMLRKGRGNTPAMLKTLVEQAFFPYVNDMYEAAKTLCAENNIVIGHFDAFPLKLAAIRSNTPHVGVIYWPGIVPSDRIPPLKMPAWGKFFIRLEWQLVKTVFDLLAKKEINKLWAREGMPPIKHVFPDAWFSNTLNLLPASSLLWQAPPDWGNLYRICGFWNMPESAEPFELPEALVRFLSAGEPPVFMSLGSAVQADPERGMDLLVRAAELAGCRTIIQTVSERFPADSTNGRIYFSGPIPHQGVFNRCAAVVHHGGAGTTQTALYYGLPSIVIAFAEEQTSWGEKLSEIGVVVKPLNYMKTSPEKVAEAIKLVISSPEIKNRAVKCGEIIRREDGITNAVKLIEELAAKQ